MVIVVRYADDLVLGFQHRTDAERFLRDFGIDWPSSVWNYTSGEPPEFDQSCLVRETASSVARGNLRLLHYFLRSARKRMVNMIQSSPFTEM